MWSVRIGPFGQFIRLGFPAVARSRIAWRGAARSAMTSSILRAMFDERVIPSETATGLSMRGATQ
jgi:hypothetical protein